MNSANQIVEWLCSNDPTLIEKAFDAYTPDLEQAVKVSLQSRSSDLQEIDFANLPLNHIYIEDMTVRDDLYRVELIEIDGLDRDVYLVQPQYSSVEFEFNLDEGSIGKMRGLLSCLKGDCWLSDVFSESDGVEADFDDVSAFYFQEDTQTIYRLSTSGGRGNLRRYDDVSIFCGDFKAACENSCLHIDEEVIGGGVIPILYFLCMKAGVSYSEVAPCTLPFNPSDPIEIQYAEQGIEWKIVDSELELDLTPYFT